MCSLRAVTITKHSLTGSFFHVIFIVAVGFKKYYYALLPLRTKDDLYMYYSKQISGTLIP